MERYTGLVEQLEAATKTLRTAYDEATATPEAASATELAGLLTAVAQAERAAAAAAVALTAQIARREEVYRDELRTADNPDGATEQVHALGWAGDFASTDLAVLLGVSTRSADGRLSRAIELATRMPRLLHRVAEGGLELGQARAAVRELVDVPTAELAREVDAWLDMRVEHADPTRLAQLTRYAVSRVCPDAVRTEVGKRVADRSFTVCPGPAGMSEVYASIPSDRAAVLWEAADDLARTYLAEDASLTMDQARADAFVDLALGGVDLQVRLEIGVPVVPTPFTELGDPAPNAALAAAMDAEVPHVPFELTEEAAIEADGRRDVDHDPFYARHRDPTDDDRPVDILELQQPFGALGGCALSGVWVPKVGYVPADVICRLASLPATSLNLAFLDAGTGTLLGTVVDSYRPSRAMRHFVEVRDGRCRMFGCDRPAVTVDLDHAVAHPRGPTGPANLAGLCRRHHRAKQRRNWQYELSTDGVATWTSPDGVQRRTHPIHHVPVPDAVPDAEPPPVESPPF